MIRYLAALVLFSAVAGATACGNDPTSPKTPEETQSKCGFTPTSATSFVVAPGDPVSINGDFPAQAYTIEATSPKKTTIIHPTATQASLTFAAPPITADAYDASSKRLSLLLYVESPKCPGPGSAFAFFLDYKPVFQYSGTFHFHSTGLTEFAADSGLSSVFKDAVVAATLKSQAGNSLYVDSQTLTTPPAMTYAAGGRIHSGGAWVTLAAAGAGAMDNGGVFMALDPGILRASLLFSAVKKNALTLIPGGSFDFAVSAPPSGLGLPTAMPMEMDNDFTIEAGSFSATGTTPGGTPFSISLDWPDMKASFVH